MNININENRYEVFFYQIPELLIISDKRKKTATF